MVAPPSPCTSMIRNAPRRSCRAKASACSRNATSRGESLLEGLAAASPGRVETPLSKRLRHLRFVISVSVSDRDLAEHHQGAPTIFLNNPLPHFVHVQSIDS